MTKSHVTHCLLGSIDYYNIISFKNYLQDTICSQVLLLNIVLPSLELLTVLRANFFI